MVRKYGTLLGAAVAAVVVCVVTGASVASGGAAASGSLSGLLLRVDAPTVSTSTNVCQISGTPTVAVPGLGSPIVGALSLPAAARILRNAASGGIKALQDSGAGSNAAGLYLVNSMPLYGTGFFALIHITTNSVPQTLRVSFHADAQDVSKWCSGEPTIGDHLYEIDWNTRSSAGGDSGLLGPILDSGTGCMKYSPNGSGFTYLIALGDCDVSTIPTLRAPTFSNLTPAPGTTLAQQASAPGVKNALEYLNSRSGTVNKTSATKALSMIGIHPTTVSAQIAYADAPPTITIDGQKVDALCRTPKQVYVEQYFQNGKHTVSVLASNGSTQARKNWTFATQIKLSSLAFAWGAKTTGITGVAERLAAKVLGVSVSAFKRGWAALNAAIDIVSTPASVGSC